MTTSSAETREKFEALARFLQQHIGYTLFTISRDLPNGKVVERVYSTQPVRYPIGGVNVIDQTEWTRQIQRGQCFIANTPSEFGEHFRNLETLVSEGFGAVMNIPVMHEYRKLGTLNLLSHEGEYRGDFSVACRQASSMAAQALLSYAKAAAA